MFYQTRYIWESGLKEMTPGLERIFNLGDRVLAHHKGKKYGGTVVEIIRVRGPKKQDGTFFYHAHPEVTIRTDNQVDPTSGALLEGFGLRGDSDLFRFEDETEEKQREYLSPRQCDISLEEKTRFRKLPSAKKRQVVASESWIPLDW